ncbi:MAG: replication initiation negative regulator SeqA [Parashewanella sp.]
MKYIEVDEELYRFIASKTQQIGESASDILRRELGLSVKENVTERPVSVYQPSLDSETIMDTSAAVVSSDERINIEFETLFDSDEIEKQKGAVGRFLYVLSQVSNAFPQEFDQVLKVQGRGRLYFATSKEALLKASKTANPKQVADSDYWVTTNNNTAKKRTIFAEVLQLFGCDAELAKSISMSI